MITILDASVITKWFFKEEDSKLALKIRLLHEQRKIIIHVPVLLLFELGNVFVSRKLTSQAAFKNCRSLFDLGIKFINPDDQLFQLIFRNSQKYSISFYDSTYVALAQNLKCDFITADQKLYQATKNLKFVKLLARI